MHVEIITKNGKHYCETYYNHNTGRAAIGGATYVTSVYDEQTLSVIDKFTKGHFGNAFYYVKDGVETYNFKSMDRTAKIHFTAHLKQLRIKLGLDVDPKTQKTSFDAFVCKDAYHYGINIFKAKVTLISDKVFEFIPYSSHVTERAVISNGFYYIKTTTELETFINNKLAEITQHELLARNIRIELLNMMKAATLEDTK